MAKSSDASPPFQGSRPRRRSPQKAQDAAFPLLERLARRLESLRLERGLTQEAVAERAGISTNHYQDVAHARANPTVIVFLRLADALGVSVADLFEAPAPPSGEHRLVFTADLQELAATHQLLADSHRRLTEIVKRLAKNEMPPRSRHPKRQPGR
jgi:transcriptional regulator with XRE-family HTH domain